MQEYWIECVANWNGGGGDDKDEVVVSKGYIGTRVL